MSAAVGADVEALCSKCGDVWHVVVAKVGERVDHPSFGQGVVEIAEPGKITVFFATGRRVLVQSKEGATAGSGLSRPKPFDHTNTAGGKPVGET